MLAFWGCGQHCGAFEIDEWNVATHVFGNTGREGANLFMDTHQEGVGRPATLLADGVAVLAVQFHGHRCLRFF
jgi:hypothetical protein